MRRNRFFSIEAIEEPTINLTPLIDVVFVVLIMFIVVAPILEMDQVELASAASSPAVEKQATKEASKVTLHVLQDNTIRLNQRKVSVTELTPLLQSLKKQYPTATPQVLHDRRASFGTYQNVKNAVEAAGFHQMDIVLTPG